jgi:nucleotide-binding universal stress UspA family protein
MKPIRSIVHPTDFSATSMEAFFHALRIAVTLKAHLSILHVAAAADDRDWMAFPQVRTVLARWGMMEEHEPTAAICEKLGIHVSKIELAPQSTIRAIMAFIDKHPPDLMVLSTEGRQGVARWLHGSIAERLARDAKAPTLFVQAKARGFVDSARGEMRLKRVLIPVDREPKPAAAIGTVMKFARTLAGLDVEERLLHVGNNPPRLERHDAPHVPAPVAVRHGDVVNSIIEAAADWQPDLIGMPTAGHQGVMDALRGSTTERVLRQAPCPLLAVPVAA